MSFVAIVNIFAAALTFLIYSESKTVFILFFATFVINVGLIAGVSYGVSLFIVPWIIYYSALFFYWFFSRIPSLQSNVTMNTLSNCYFIAFLGPNYMGDAIQ